MANIRKVFGMMNKKKADDSDEESPAYTDPAMIHSMEPPSRNARGILQPHYPPPRPCHNTGGTSPNARRKDNPPGQGPRRPQSNESNRNSQAGFVGGEPQRAPPRINIAKKANDPEDDYCDPIDVQRKDDFIQEMKSRPRDDYCEPWDATTKTDDFANLQSKRQQNASSDQHNEYLEPYDTGKEGFMEKRTSRGIGKEFGVHGRGLTPEQRRSADVKTRSQAFDPSQPPSDDYDMPWEWQQKMAKAKAGKQQTQKSVPSAGPPDDYDEPWEKKQSYLFKNQVPASGGKQRSPVPIPRSLAQAGGEQLYEEPTEAQAAGMYETSWDASSGRSEVNGTRRLSQPALQQKNLGQFRKLSQPVSAPTLDDYDTPWEYKNKEQFGMISPFKPPRLHEIANAQEIDPDLPLDQQSWYHGPLKRFEAEELLRDALDCSFLVRNSESSKKDFSLSMKNNENFLHLKIVRQLDGQFILGQFSKPFLDIPKVIFHYSKNKLNIRGAEHKLLKHPVSVQPEYHTIEPEEDDVAL